MKKILLSLVVILCILPQIFAQTVYSKDGIELGDRRDLIESCVAGMAEEVVLDDGLTVSARSICSCMIDQLLPKMTVDDFLSLTTLDDEEIENILLVKYFQDILICLGKEDPDLDSEISLRGVIVDACVEQMGNDQQLADAGFSRSQARQFCSCAVDKILLQGYSYEQILHAEDENGAVFNEVIMGCIDHLMDVSGLASNVYNSSDIRGGGESSQVTLLNFASVGHKVKLSICGVDKYFLFDTGASDMLISQELADELQRQGCIGADNYLGETRYVTADGKTVNAVNLVLNNVKIGDYTVDNVIVGVIDGGSLLCGLGLLQKFQKWEVTNGGQMLLLYK